MLRQTPTDLQYSFAARRASEYVVKSALNIPSQLEHFTTLHLFNWQQTTVFFFCAICTNNLSLILTRYIGQPTQQAAGWTELTGQRTNSAPTCMLVLLIVRRKCTLDVSLAAPWWVTVSTPMGQTAGRMPDWYIAFSARRGQRNKVCVRQSYAGDFTVC